MLLKWTRSASGKEPNRNTGNALQNEQTIHLLHHLGFDNSLTEKICHASQFVPDSLTTESKGKNTLDLKKL